MFLIFGKVPCRENKNTQPVFMGFIGTYRGAWRSCDFKQLFLRVCLCVGCYYFRQVRFFLPQNVLKSMSKEANMEERRKIVLDIEKNIMRISSIDSVIGKIREVVKELTGDSRAAEDAL